MAVPQSTAVPLASSSLRHRWDRRRAPSDDVLFDFDELEGERRSDAPFDFDALDESSLREICQDALDAVEISCAACRDFDFDALDAVEARAAGGACAAQQASDVSEDLSPHAVAFEPQEACQCLTDEGEVGAGLEFERFFIGDDMLRFEIGSDTGDCLSDAELSTGSAWSSPRESSRGSSIHVTLPRDESSCASSKFDGREVFMSAVPHLS